MLARAATAALCYPLLIVAAVYAEWLYACVALGHFPGPADPSVAGWDLSRRIVMFLLLGLIPALIAALLLNVMHVQVDRPATGPLLRRLALTVFVWVALVGLALVDPGGVWSWWMD